MWWHIFPSTMSWHSTITDKTLLLQQLIYTDQGLECQGEFIANYCVGMGFDSGPPNAVYHVKSAIFNDSAKLLTSGS
jgi:hypothetical protein